MTFVALHGANSSGAELEPLTAALRHYGEVWAPNLLGHGGREVREAFTVREVADDLLAQLGERGIARPAFLGYSLGGLAALDIALRFPERVQALGAIATRLFFDEATIKHWTYLASLERLDQPGNPRAAQLAKAHAPRDWRDVARSNQRFFAELLRNPPFKDEDLAAFRVPIMMIGGDRDQVAPWPTVLETGKRIPGCRLVMFYGNAHPIAVVPVTQVARVFAEWVHSLSP